jgi:ankyrin repeat protein
LAVVAGLIVAGVWWSQRPTREDFLYRAARGGEASELRRLLDEGPPGPGEASALVFAAASSGSVPTVSLLLERGVDVNHATMLHVAVKHHHLDLVRFLLQHGADTSLRGVDGVTPLGLAARSAVDLPIVRALLEGGASPNDWWALYNAPPEVLPVLLDATDTPEAVSADGRTNLLSLAANRGDATGARTLLAKGAAVDKAPPNGPRPLIAALNGRSPALVGVLLEHGASPDSSSDAEPPPLEVAVEQGLPEAAQLLLEKGARVEQCPKLRGESPGAIVEYAKKRK